MKPLKRVPVSAGGGRSSQNVPSGKAGRVLLDFENVITIKGKIKINICGIP